MNTKSASHFQHSHGVSLMLAIFGGCVGYILAHLSVLPLLYYLPVERQWTFEPGQHIATRYYGILLDVGLCAAGAALLGGLEVVKKALSEPPWPQFLARTAIITILATLLYIAVVEFVAWS